MEKLTPLLGLKASSWMMAPSERLAILGLLLMIKPRWTLELGCASAGQTQWLSQYSDHVVSVDMDSNIEEVVKPFANVRPLCMLTKDVWELIRKEGLRFALTIIDADHSQEGVRLDLENALEFSQIIILHDTYYPPCRKGIIEALRHRDVYFDLDFVTGGLQPDGLWGGLGLVMPGISRKAVKFNTPRRSNYHLNFIIWLIQKKLKTAAHFVKHIKSKIK